MFKTDNPKFHDIGLRIITTNLEYQIDDYLKHKNDLKQVFTTFL